MDERVKLPRIVRLLLFTYIGVIGVMILTDIDMGDRILVKVIWGISLSVYTSVAAYGFISLVEDFKKKGLKYIIIKVRRFLNV